MSGCGTPGEQTPAPGVAGDAVSTPWFRDRAADLGLVFTHVNGATSHMYLAEIMGSGAALLDYDGDGDLDAYLVQGGRINDTAAPRFPSAETAGQGRLFRNRLIPDGELRFEDVTSTSGIPPVDVGMGVAVGDIDSDGDPDLYLTNLGRDVLLLNQGDGTFAPAAAQPGAELTGWSTSAVFFDADVDGRLDLLVAGYVELDRTNPRHCAGQTGLRDYCTPDVYRPRRDVLLRGEDLAVDEGWAPGSTASTGLGVATGDYDADGLLDVYVANDKRPNQLWRNLGTGRFADVALLSGSALNSAGEAEASMGIASGDADGDGDEDVFLTHLKGETNTLYTNAGAGVFADGTIRAGLAAASVPATGFGVGWLDVDLDGDLDLFVANGAVMVEPEQMDRSAFPYEQRNQLFENLGDGRFEDASAAAGFADEEPEISRGAAFGDIDNDGDVDILVSNNHGMARLLVNEAPRRGDWLSVRLVDTSGNRDGIGARVAVNAAEVTPWRRVTRGGSYLSASDVRAHLGLGEKAGPAVTVDVVWVDGEAERWEGLPVNRMVRLERGSPRASLIGLGARSHRR